MQKRGMFEAALVRAPLLFVPDAAFNPNLQDCFRLSN